MTPYEQAQLVYNSEPCARTFAQDRYYHFKYGYVINTPDYFVMLRPVRHTWPEEQIVDPRIGGQNTDCWHVYLAAGDLRKMFFDLWTWLPRKSLVSYERKNVLKIRHAQTLFNRIYRLNPS